MKSDVRDKRAGAEEKLREDGAFVCLREEETDY